LHESALFAHKGENYTLECSGRSIMCNVPLAPMPMKIPNLPEQAHTCPAPEPIYNDEAG